MDHDPRSILFPQELLKVFPEKIADRPCVVDVSFNERNRRIDNRQIKFRVFEHFLQELEQFPAAERSLARSDDSQILVNEYLLLLGSGYFRNTLALPNAFILRIFGLDD